MSRPLLVTATPPTPNGDLHVGHLAGPYLGADALCRQARMAGRDVVYVTSTDDHQSYLVRRAELRGTDPAETALHYGGLIRRSLECADIAVDAFTQPVTSPVHDRFVGEFFTRLAERGHIRPADTPSLWCDGCRRHLVDYDALGSCGYCAAACDVGICEECGRPSSPLTLREPRCIRCGAVPELRTLRRLAIDLAAYAGPLHDYHATVRSPTHTRALWETLASGGLPVAAVAHPGTWGVPVSVRGFADHRWWGMAEMGVGYVATTMLLAEQRADPDGWQRYWSGDAEVVQFFGYDNSYWQTILHPALLLADGRFRPADHAVVNEFYRLDGHKFSSSKNHAVWASELLEQVSSDHVRYYLCRTAPKDEQTNFTLDEFASVVNAELAGEVGSALDRALYHAHDESGGAEPVLATALAYTDVVTQALEPRVFSLPDAIGAWRGLALAVGAAAPDADRAELRAALSLLASTAYPLLPRFAQRLWSFLGVRRDLARHPWGEPIALSTVPQVTGEPWFPAVDRARIGAGVMVS